MVKIKHSAFRFGADNNGGASLHAAMLFGAVGLAMALLLTPQLKNASDHYAENKAMGIDRVVTGSIETKKQRIIRKSVLD